MVELALNFGFDIKFFKISGENSDSSDCMESTSSSVFASKLFIKKL